MVIIQASNESRPRRQKDPGEIFSEQYMENFIGSHYQGENSPELNRLMEELLKNGPAPEAEVSNLLDRIADMRGVDRQAFRQDYQTYLNLWENASSKGNIDLSRHGDFLGSTVSLRYGAVIGDVFGVDPVFGALLNPTGGLVGPGDNAYQPGINDAIGYHGVFHDAGGYLLNIQGGIGPGYDYLGRDLLPTTSPVSGQVGGISFWLRILNWMLITCQYHARYSLRASAYRKRHHWKLSGK
ncbi:MAG: hypothetical protein IPH82_30260 [Chloroflexi bacterium]|nr:hypothetical protein [Chloroflexota bacterium]